MCLLVRNALVYEARSSCLLVQGVEFLAHVVKVRSLGGGQMLFLFLLDAGGSPWGIGSWLGSMSPPVLIMGQRKKGRTLITHLKKSLAFLLFSYFLLDSY